VKRLLASIALIPLVACAPTPEQVADRCEREVRSTTAVSGEFGMGYASGRGFVNTSKIGISAGVNLGGARDPRMAYEDCVRARSGQGPVRPLGTS
jgi:hypothetical protein